MLKKTTGAQAKELVLLFYEKTGLKYTNKNIMIAIKNAKTLLNAGYTYEEIRDTILYCVAKTQNKKIAKEEAINSSAFSDYGIQNVSNKDKIKPNKDFGNINIFD